MGNEIRVPPSNPTTLMSKEPIDEAVVHADGWFVIRNTDDPEQWLAIDAPVDIRR